MATDKENLAWLDGYRSRLEGKPKPSSGLQRQSGWQAADNLLKLATAHGGYGSPA